MNDIPKLNEPCLVAVWPGMGNVALNAGIYLLSKLDMPTAESVTVKGAGGTPMQMWILKPPGFDSSRRWPLVYLVHGGPQGAWTDGWSFRWNPELWAAQGYVIALPNPRGSTGYGQAHTAGIWGNVWGEGAYHDVMAVADAVSARADVDPQRVAAMGGSFGGYMSNWIGANTDRFRCIVTHASVFSMTAFYGVTDVPSWWAFSVGVSPYDDFDEAERYSPHGRCRRGS